MILASLFAALTAVGAFIKIPLPYVPFTLQLFFVLLAGALLGSRLGVLSQLVYIAIGLIGVPIFAQGGGPSYVLQPTFGYLIGYVFCAYLVGKLIESKSSKNFFTYLWPMYLGLGMIYLFGVIYLYLIIHFLTDHTFTLFKAISIGLLTFLPKDLLLTGITAFLASKIIKRIPKEYI